jgi:hypothetical protein
MKKPDIKLKARISWLTLIFTSIFLCMPSLIQADWLKTDPPPDVDKAFFGHPNNVRSCALATAANMLASVGYGSGTDMQAKANSIYTDLTTSNQYISLVQNPGTGGAWIDVAIKFWLDNFNNDPTNPYLYTTVRGFKSPKYPTDTDLPMYMGNELRMCMPVGLSISWPVNGPTIGQDGHAITCWGDSGGASLLTGNPAQLLVTDSDMDTGGDVQTYTYDSYTNPNPGGANEGNGWYFNYNWWNSTIHPYIKHIAILHPVKNLPEQTGGRIVICVGSYELHQNNDVSATDLHYTVWTDTKILSYKTSIDWPTNNPPTITEVTRASGPPPHEHFTEGIEVTWDLTDNPVPYCTMVKITTEFVLKYTNALLYEDVYFTHGDDGWASEKKPSFSWRVVTPEIDPNDLPPNVTGGYVIGAFNLTRAGDPIPIGEYRFIHEYSYDEDPEIHVFEFTGDPEQRSESFEATNFRFGHSYGLPDETILWEFEDWLTRVPDETIVLGSDPCSYDLNWEGLLPYPEGEVYQGRPPVEEPMNPVGVFDDAKDIGNPTGIGRTVYEGYVWNGNMLTEQYLIMGGGGDIWDDWDQFHYAYKMISGDVRLSASFEWIVASNDWAKYGVMLRDPANDGASVHYSMIDRKARDYAGMQYREETGGASSEIGARWQTGARVLGIQRVTVGGLPFMQGLVDFGNGWESVGTKIGWNLPDEVMAGVIITSHDDNQLVQARVWNVNYEMNPILVGELDLPLVPASANLGFCLSDVPGFSIRSLKPLITDGWGYDAMNELLDTGTWMGLPAQPGTEGTRIDEFVNLCDTGNGVFSEANGYPDKSYPGIDPLEDPAQDPAAGDDDDNFATEILGCIQLTAGLHIIGACSDDGTIIEIGGVEVGRTGEWKGTSNEDFLFEVEVDGCYELRARTLEGGGGASIELHEVLIDGTRILLNDVANGGSAVFTPVIPLPPPEPGS